MKIIAPKTNGNFDWDTQVNYQINVADKEDGDSKYEEINGMEVLLEVKYTDSKTKLPATTKATPDAPGLAVIRTSNCFSCHSFNGKLIGPSFHDIGVKYPVTSANIDLLTKRIKEGSAGIWGKVSMPTHPELTADEAASTVKWILKQANDPNVSYYTGTEGAFRTRPAGTEKKGTYILTASYTDHGLKGGTGKRLKGEDVVILKR
ncbi:c-type cytochrome [Mucilaginibacter sp.]|uniref:c-type cytochrome n=1 Tax=Mucilaginibacter sp. TaxID=1882438 RepID=UPI00262B5396|nr:c-type cytochrome [Mucilaginibacter sp.]